MFVIKRSGLQEEINFDKVTRRISSLAKKIPEINIDVIEISKKVIAGVYSGVRTTELDTLACEICAQLVSTDPDYGILAARIWVSSMHKETPNKFSEYVDCVSHLFEDRFLSSVSEIRDAIDAAVVDERDYTFSYFGLKTLEKSYLAKKDGIVVERPQYLFMRVAVALHGNNLEKVLETYNLMSLRFFVHATPTLFNAGKHNQQLSSCFVTQINDDSIDGIFDTIKQCALISKSAGGIGLSVSNVRAAGSDISGGGQSNGLVPMLRVFNNVARYVDQGGNKRPGAIAVYLEPWHADIFDFLELRKNHGKDEMRARDIFTALWIPDLFMRRVKNNEQWSLFCPNKAPGLDECWGTDFEKLYTEYESSKPCKKVAAQSIWKAIIESQIETGTPYMLYKDACNRTSNHNHLGTIKGSNLCQEIIQYFDKNETAVCNLASVGLPAFIENGTYNYTKLGEVVRVAVRNLDNIIDMNTYPTPQAKKSNTTHRPIGLGVQGLADVFVTLKFPFDSADARALNKNIFETIYYNALWSSCELAKEKGCYGSYANSRVANGVLHHDAYSLEESKLHDWPLLRSMIAEYGVRNSLLVAPMPTASTSQILGYNECIEPFTSNIYTRRVRSGEFQVVNTHLVNVLKELGIWNLDTKNEIMRSNGSISNILSIPESTRALFRTAWEISQKSILEMSADRQPYIDQSQSLNIHMEDATFAKMSSMHFYGWERNLKSGMYYLRSRPAVRSIQFTVEPAKSCAIGCESCSA